MFDQNPLGNDERPYICEFCIKKYKSFPALYTHVKNKHDGCHVSSVKNKQKQEKQNYGAFKLKTLCKNKFSDRQKVQIKLQKCIFLTANNILESFQGMVAVENKSLGKISINEIKSKLEQTFPKQQIEKNYQNVFKEYYGKLCPLNFGKELLGFFKTEVMRNNLCIQLLLLGSKRYQEKEKELWGQRIKISHVIWNGWRQWQKTDKTRLLQPYDESQQNFD